MARIQFPLTFKNFLLRAKHRLFPLLIGLFFLGIFDSPRPAYAETIKAVAQVFNSGNALGKHYECRAALSQPKVQVKMTPESEDEIPAIVSFFQKEIESNSMTLLSHADKSWVEDKARIFSALTETNQFRVTLYVIQMVQLHLKNLDDVEGYNQNGFPIPRSREQTYAFISDFYLIQIAISGLASLPRIYIESKGLRRDLYTLGEKIARNPSLPQPLQDHFLNRWFP